MSILTPRIEDQRISVAAVLAQPTLIRAKLEELTEKDEVLSAFFSPLGTPVQGGGIAHSRMKTGDRYTAQDVVERAPGDEYQRVDAVDPDYYVSVVRDYGAKTTITDEEIARGDTSALNSKMLQLTNTLVRKLNTSALAAIDDVNPEAFIAAKSWEDFLIVGPSSSITPNNQRPLRDFVEARRLAEEDRLSTNLNTLVVSSRLAAALRIGYGEELPEIFKAADITSMVVSPYVDETKAYMCEKGKAGMVGYETVDGRPAGLTVDVIDRRETRDKVIQVYAVPSFAVDRPQAVKVITGCVVP